jgi:hypothetical protein
VSSIVAFRARLLYHDAEYLINLPSTDTSSDIKKNDHHQSPPHTRAHPLFICFHSLDLNTCAPIPATDGNVKANFEIQSTSTLTVVKVVLCRREWNERIDQQLPIKSMEECLLSLVEDSLSLHLRSPSANNDLPAMLVGEDSAGLAEGEAGTHTQPGRSPVGLLISTLDPGLGSDSGSGSGSSREDVLALETSLLSYMLGMSSDVYIIVPHTSVCASLSALSIMCCPLTAPGRCRLRMHTRH